MTACLAAALLCGCPDVPPDDAPASSTAPEDAVGRSDAAPAAPRVETRETTAGLWRLSLLDNGAVTPAFVILVDGDSVEQVAKADAFKPLNVTGGSATAEEVRLDLTLDLPEDVEAVNRRQSIVATLQDGRLLGALDFGAGRNFVLMEATDDEALDGVKPEPLTSARDFAAVTQAENAKLQDIREFLLGLDADPIKYLGLRQLLGFGRRAGIPAEQYLADAKAFAKSGEVWGEGFAAEAAREAALNYVGYPGMVPAEARLLLRRAEELAGEPTEQDSQEDLRAASVRVELSDPETDETEAIAAAEALISELPSSPMRLDLKSLVANRRGDTEGELRAVAEMTMVPNGVTDGPRLLSLYEKARGSVEGMEAYLMGVYRESLTGFLSGDEEYPGGRPALVELFTGQSCAPCVAADVAVEAAEKAFGSDLIALRFHMDIPSPDPLTTAVGRERFKQYGFRGTPTAAVNGRPVEDLFGAYDRAAARFERLSEALGDAPAAEDVQIDVSATRPGEPRVMIEASASGVPEDRDVRLLVALASDEVKMRADNGILVHGMVVRDMAPGPDGVPAEGGSAKLATEINIRDSRNQIVQNMAVPFATLKDEFRPAVTEFGAMTVVAFLQDFETMEVLAAATAKVPAAEGEEDAGEAEAKSADPAPDARSTGEEPKSDGPPADGSPETTADAAADGPEAAGGSVEQVPADDDN